MTELHSKEVGQFFDGYADSFDAIYGHTRERGWLGRWVDVNFRGEMVSRFNETLKILDTEAVESVIDVGCGPGRYAIEFLKRGMNVMAIDLAQGMVELATKVCGDVKYEGRIQFHVCDYMEYVVRERSDAAVLMGVFDYIKEPELFLSKLKKDTKKIIVASFPRDGGALAFQRKVRYRMRKCPLYLYRKESIEKFLKDTSLTNHVITESRREYFVTIYLDREMHEKACG